MNKYYYYFWGLRPNNIISGWRGTDKKNNLTLKEKSLIVKTPDYFTIVPGIDPKNSTSLAEIFSSLLLENPNEKLIIEVDGLGRIKAWKV
jgi:hypothetical protein